MNYAWIGLYVERLFSSRNGIVFCGRNNTTWGNFQFIT